MSSRAHRFITLMLLAGVLSWAASSDTMFLRNGEQESGRLAGMTAKAVRFETPGGVKTLDKAEVVRIQLQRSRTFDDVATADQVTDPDLKACLAAQPSLKDFPSAGSVTLLSRRVHDLTTPGAVKSTVREITKVLQQRGETAASYNIWYFEDADAPNVDFALTVTPDGRVLHLSDDALKNESLYANLPVYRRLARFRFACKEPRPGAILDVQYTVVRKRTDATEPFYRESLFRGDQPLLRQEVIVFVREAEESRVAAELSGPDVIQTARDVRDGVVCHKWVLAEPQQGIMPEPLMPPKEDFAPMLAVGEAGTWEAAARAYAEVLAKAPPLPQDLVDKAVALDAQNGPQAIHGFLARTVRTVSVPQLYYRLEPHSPEEVFRQSLGNELDKNFLYFRMLEAAGIPCAFALVRQRAWGPLHEDVPSLRAFDRTAVLIKKDGWFSTVVSDVLAFDTLPGELQGAPALVIEAGGGLLTETQCPRPQEELEATAFQAALDADGTLALEVQYAGTGVSAAWMRGLKDIDAQQLRNTFQQIASALHPGAALVDYTTTDLADLAVPPTVTLRCNIPGYAVKAGEDLMLLDLPAVRYTAEEVGRPTREHGLYWDRVVSEISQGVIRLPKGFHVYAMPESVAYDSSTAAYQATLNAAGGTLVFKDTYQQKVHDAPSSAYPEYKACVELRANLPRQRIILTR